MNLNFGNASILFMSASSVIIPNYDTTFRFSLFLSRITRSLTIFGINNVMGHTLTQLVEALRYNPEGRGFDSRLVSLEFFIHIFLPAALWP
jgi:hypothetical protein